MYSKKISLFILLIFFVCIKAQATAQYGDILIVEKDTSWIYSNPLETYFDKKGSRTIDSTEMSQNCTALWRGYVATWRLENKKLYLIRIQINYCDDNPIDIDLVKEFGSNKVFANWVTETIVRPKGKLLQHVHMGYLSIYAEEDFYNFKNGLLINTKNQNYVSYDKNKLFPSIDFLHDTIKSVILKSIDSVTRSTFNTDSLCNLTVRFNEDGQIDNITAGYEWNSNKAPRSEMERIVLEKAINALKGFPKLMKVLHNSYRPPTVTLHFSGHCLKYPYDRTYGCNDE